MPENFMPHALYHENSNGNPIDSYGRPMLMVTQEQMAAMNEMNSKFTATVAENAETNKLLRETAEHMLHQEKEMEAVRKDMEASRAENKKLQTQLACANGKIERLCTTPPLGGKKQFLTYDAHYDGGLTLVTRDVMNDVESRCTVSNTILQEAIWVRACTGDKYLSLKFLCGNNTKASERVVHLPDEVYQSNTKLLNYLCQAGIVINFKAAVSTKATLLREYFSAVGNGHEKKECKIGWDFNESWQFFRPEQLAWWDRRKKIAVVHESLHNIFMAFKKLQEAVTSLMTPEKIMLLLPYAAELLPLVAAKGCRNTTAVNMVMQCSPQMTDFASRITGSDAVISLPMKEKNLCKKLKNMEGVVWLFRVRESAYLMEEKRLLDENLRSISEVADGAKLPVYISAAPLVMRESGMIILELNEVVASNFPHFTRTKTVFESYISQNAMKVAGQIRLDKIPSELGEWGTAYVLFWLAERVLWSCIKQYLGIESCRPIKNSNELCKFFSMQRMNSDTDGLSFQVIDCIQEAVEQQLVKTISPYRPMTELDVVIVSDREIYMRRDTFKSILSASFAAYNETVILRTLYEEGFLVADVGKKINFTTRRRCTSADGEPKYTKFLVFRKEKLVSVGDFDYFDQDNN